MNNFIFVCWPKVFFYIREKIVFIYVGQNYTLFLFIGDFGRLVFCVSIHVNTPNHGLAKAVTAPLLPQKRRWYDAGGFPYRSACTKQPRYAPWMLVPESLVALVAEVRLTYIGVSKTNDHSRELTVPVQKTELVQTKVK
ncbi:Hypothetical_protein [Hexamita inflata]|uniref:Hypothetical_protein n=1 Tax=Hexamita inflata TaxID=28002 RepID=A0AA86PKG0_9EUKA|nr:Hypothetical protein HINF_LOCUS24772 [Hexamita inflata]